jgi:hypothetical protein
MKPKEISKFTVVVEWQRTPHDDWTVDETIPDINSIRELHDVIKEIKRDIWDHEYEGLFKITAFERKVRELLYLREEVTSAEASA